MLGSSRIVGQNGTIYYDADFYPYGGERAYYNPYGQEYIFEGKERDTETGNDDFGARYYSNRFGRWLSADWSNVPAPVPYANLSNPQTLNLYSMVADDPESFADLDGHDKHCWGEKLNNAECQSDNPKSAKENTSPASQSANQHFQTQGKSAYDKYIEQESRPVTEADNASALKQAGEMGDAGVKAGLVVVGGEAAVVGAVVAAPTIAAASTQAGTAISTATTSAYVQVTTAVSAVWGAAANGLNNARDTAQTVALRAAVWADNFKSRGGNIGAAQDFFQAATSNRTPPKPNSAGIAGFAVKILIKIVSK